VANDEHVALLNQGVAAWNAWREENPDIFPNLKGAHLRGANLIEAKLSRANLSGARLSQANLSGARLSQANLTRANLTGADLTAANLMSAKLSLANLSGAWLSLAELMRANLTGANLIEAKLIEAKLNLADLTGADLSRAELGGADLMGAKLSGAILREARFGSADLSGADFTGADLTGTYLVKANFSDVHLNRAYLVKANLSAANLMSAKLSRANLSGANLQAAILVNTDLTGADRSGCRIHGVSAWGLKPKGAKQRNLVITPVNEPEITVDNIEVAQFIYLLLHNEKIRDVIDTITSKAVLILGRFTDERKAVLNALRKELRGRNYLPILFDFDKPASRDITETISLLARMARFVLADITDARSIPQELNVIVPDLPSVPVQPLLLNGSGEYGMFEHYTRYRSVLPIYHYETQDQLIAVLGEQVIEPAERMAFKLRAGTK
jgi:uncharacterized protein YjbI with pentapeptide repeats